MNRKRLFSMCDGSRSGPLSKLQASGCLHLKHLLTGTLLVMLFQGFVSCRQPSAPGSEAERHETPVHFAKGMGLALSKESWSHMGIQLTQLNERAVSASIKSTAQVFRDSTEDTSLNGTYRRGFAYASARVPVSLAKDCRVKMPVTATKADDASLKIEGRVLLVDQTLQPATQTVEVILELPDPSERLPFGAFVVAAFEGATTQSLLAVPRSALLKAGEGDFVYIKNGKYLLRVPVEVASANTEWAGIAKGLYPGDRVVAGNVETLWLTELAMTQKGSHCD